MPLPKHVNPTHDAALAPYNFVPLPDNIFTVDAQKLPDHDGFYPDRSSGHIDCVLTTESPLYVRCPLTLDEFKAEDEAQQPDKPWREQVRNRPDFYYTEPGKPRIPGSSLRGMLRSIVEIASYSKLAGVSDRRLVYRAVGDTSNHGELYRSRIMHFDGEGKNRDGKRCLLYTPMVKAGYMELDRSGDWHIRPAKEIGGTTFARINHRKIPQGMPKRHKGPNFYEIYVEVEPYEYRDVRGGFLRIRHARVSTASAKAVNGWRKGTLAYSGEMFSKHTEAVVYEADEGAPLIDILDELELAYREQISPEQQELLGPEGVLRPGQPVFYLMDGKDLVFFGHTMMMRLPYKLTPAKFAPDMVEPQPQVDFAESIFGYTKSTGEGKERAYASRVTVSDAVLEPEQKDPWLAEGIIVPRILGGPKPTTFQHYLVQQQPDAIEVGRTRDGTPRMQKQLSDYAVSPPKTVLRGHKLYWHKGAVTAEAISVALEQLKEKDTQHTQIRPVRAGVRFAFRIHFENLSDEELGALLWSLVLPDVQGKEHRHSLGMGKPYGMGAVRLEAQAAKEQPGVRYGGLFDDGSGWLVPLESLLPAEVDRTINAFDLKVRTAIGARRAGCLAEVERIQMLLKLMEWPGPDRRLTRYLEIEHEDTSSRRGKVNEYKDRPVLPDPLHVEALFGTRAPTDGPARAPAPTQRELKPQSVFSSDELGAKPARPAPPPPTVKTPPADAILSTPASAKDLQPDMLVEARVLRLEQARVVLEILGEEASLPWDRITPVVAEWEREELFPAGANVRVLIRGRNKAGRLQAAMRRS